MALKGIAMTQALQQLANNKWPSDQPCDLILNNKTLLTPNTSKQTGTSPETIEVELIIIS